jgi:CRISPR/Cas system endoribonuclease Cas6 (RAMP superfamily)
VATAVKLIQVPQIILSITMLIASNKGKQHNFKNLSPWPIKVDTKEKQKHVRREFKD